MKSILFALVISCAAALAGKPILGQGVNPLARIDLGNSTNFAIVRFQETDKLGWELSWKVDNGSRKRTSGPLINPQERFTYMWFADSQTVWIATPRSVEKIALEEGQTRSQSTSYPVKGYAQIPGIPEAFTKAIADLLAAR